MKSSIGAWVPYVVAISSGLPWISPGCGPNGLEGGHGPDAGDVGSSESSSASAAPMGCLPPHCAR